MEQQQIEGMLFYLEIHLFYKILYIEIHAFNIVSRCTFGKLLIFLFS